MKEGNQHVYGDEFTPIAGVSVDGVYRALPANEPMPFSADQIHAPASNTAAVLTWSAGGFDMAHALGSVSFSYSGTPTGGNLLIQDGSVTVLSLDVADATPRHYEFNRPRRGTPNRAMTITLAAGGSGVSGKLNANHWLTQVVDASILNFNIEAESGLLPLFF